MINNSEQETDTAVTVVADETIKELLKSGKIEEIQNIVQSGLSSVPTQMSCFSWMSGQQIGKYEIIRKIGKGGMGVIYLARHTQLDSLRALKVLPAENAAENPVFAERFIREARIASRIRHANVVEVMDVEHDPQLNISYIVMEYVDGGSLRQVLKAQSSLNIEQAVVTVLGVAQALAVASEHGIVHRDIKPDNIMFTQRGEVKLADLGIAKNDEEDDNLTKTNVMMGTPAYLSPEQVENPKEVDIRSDIYSLGATFYEMLTGQTPYPGKSSYDVLRKIFADPVPDPRTVKPDIPGEIAAVVMKMIAKEPEKRYQTPAQVLEAVEKIFPALSDMDVQVVVKSIVAVKKEGNSGNASCNSVFTGTLYQMRKQERRKKLLRRFCGIGAILAVCAAGAVYLPRLSVVRKAAAGKTETEKITAPVLHTLSVKSEPMSTLRLIRADGQMFTYAGNADGTFNISQLSGGVYELEISCPGYLPHKGKYDIPLGETLEVPLKLDVKNLEIFCVAGSRIELDLPGGKRMSCTVPASGVLRLNELKKGNYLVKAAHPDHIAVEKQLTLEDDMQLTLTMERCFSSCNISSYPGSQIELLQNSQVKFVQKANSRGQALFPKVRRGVYELKISAVHCKVHTSILNIEKDTQLSIPLEKLLYSVTVYGADGIAGELFSGKRKLRDFRIPASGYIVLKDIVPGEYNVTFSRKGYVGQKHKLSVQENISLPVTLSKIPTPVEKVPEPAAKAPETAASVPTGKLNIYFSASEDLLKFIRNKGLEIKLGNSEWRRIKSFPLSTELPAGVFMFGVRGEGILPQSNLQTQVYSGESTDFLLELKAVPVEVAFFSNCEDAVFIIGSERFRAGSSAQLEPFKEYKVTAEYKKQRIVKSCRAMVPGERLRIGFTFDTSIHPLQSQFEAAEKLFLLGRYKDALPELTKVAEANHPKAALLVAQIYEKGLGMWMSRRKEALKWYRKAADLKETAAAKKIADAIFEDDYEATAAEMLKFYLLAVKAKDPESTYRVSQLYKNGFREIGVDENKALRYLQLAAELGWPDAMYELGVKYEKGQGVPFNSKTALYWITKAAAVGHEPAMKYWKEQKQ